PPRRRRRPRLHPSLPGVVPPRPGGPSRSSGSPPPQSRPRPRPPVPVVSTWRSRRPCPSPIWRRCVRTARRRWWSWPAGTWPSSRRS
ncbi:MAG: hypothetical protein F4011_09035, partial [Acidimicrobiaceae bacterium]|nr:hypothetical protein [Acidimicrobiaceae bacterium]